MRIFNASTLRNYGKKHRETDSDLRSWIAFAEKAEWKKPGDVKKQFAKAGIVGSNRVVFNICGNKYRLVVKINYDAYMIFINL